MIPHASQCSRVVFSCFYFPLSHEWFLAKMSGSSSRVRVCCSMLAHTHTHTHFGRYILFPYIGDGIRIKLTFGIHLRFTFTCIVHVYPSTYTATGLLSMRRHSVLPLPANSALSVRPAGWTVDWFDGIVVRSTN